MITLNEKTAKERGLESDDISCIEIPAIRVGSGPLSPAQKNRFLSQLIITIRSAFASFSDQQSTDRTKDDIEESEFQVSSQEQTYVKRACQLCRGNCCWNGEKHPYIDVATIRRYRKEHPKLSALDIFKHYKRHIPKISINRSCIYHTTDGCNLDRNMRADLCNRFLCGPVSHALKQQRLHTKKDLIFFSVNEGKIGSIG